MTVSVVDSHTAGEPTRVVLSGGPPLGAATLPERLEKFRSDYDRFRSAIVNEPRGSDALVGALLCDPVDSSCATGIIFFNNVGYLGMCGHGTIGVAATLAHLGRIAPGTHNFETPVGKITIELHEEGDVSFENVPSYRLAKDVQVKLDGSRVVHGDIAWGGNWFFITEESPCPIELSNLEQLTDYTWKLRRTLTAQGITGANDAEIDHIEISATAGLGADSRNFVLCPGRSYDRSPCGTGTSAKLACLYADGKIREGQQYRQAGILGTVFEGSVRIREGKVFPLLRGRAYVTSEAQLIFNEQDPFMWGIRS
jgi:4-hydroxyproline epimerase